MSIPNPYFRDVPGCGNLRMEKVIVDYVYPLFFVLKDDLDSRYLCICFDTRGAQQWLITPISSSALAALLKNEITLASPFEDPHSRKFLVTMDYQTRAETFQTLDACQIPEEDLPEAGEYLDAEPGEWDEYIRTLKTDTCPIKNHIHVICHWSRPSRVSSVEWRDTPQYRKKAGQYVTCAVR